MRRINIRISAFLFINMPPAIFDYLKIIIGWYLIESFKKGWLIKITLFYEFCGVTLTFIFSYFES